MKLLCFVDLHNNRAALDEIKKKAKDADLILCAGDFTIFEQGINDLLREFNKLGPKVLIIPGNHESPGHLRSAVKGFDSIIFLHQQSYTKEGIAFVGFGDSGFAARTDEFDAWMRKNRDAWKGKDLILIVHGPPYGTKLDFLHEAHSGSKSSREFIMHFKPKLVVCGHFHENAGKEDIVGKTRIINPGAKGRIVNLDYQE